jgi:hypothetical protein
MTVHPTYHFPRILEEAQFDKFPEEYPLQPHGAHLAGETKSLGTPLPTFGSPLEMPAV